MIAPLHWRPISATAPLPAVDVLLTVWDTQGPVVWMGYRRLSLPNQWHHSESLKPIVGAVTHWMPLPEPPTEVPHESRTPAIE